MMTIMIVMMNVDDVDFVSYDVDDGDDDYDDDYDDDVDDGDDDYLHIHLLLQFFI